MTFAAWTILFAVLLAAGGLASVLAPARVARALKALPRCDAVAYVTVPVAWFWTAYECDVIGIDVFDAILKFFPGELWILAIVLTGLTLWWMKNLLPLRGLAGLFMLIPARFFPVARLVSSSAKIPVVLFVYALAILGMWAMFYPWHWRRLLAWRAESETRVRAFGVGYLALAAVFVVVLILLPPSP